MIGGQQKEQVSNKEIVINPQKPMDIEEPKPQISQLVIDKSSINSFRDIDKEVQEIVNASVSNNQLEGQNGQNAIIMEQEQSRPSPPIEESASQSASNPKEGKQKPTHLANQLLRLTKKSTTQSKQKERKERQRKVRCFITNFQPYIPSFLDELHKDHHKNIIRIGEKYQACVQTQPRFESLHRPLSHLRIWRGSEEKVSKQALKKFREIYGENRTEEELILLKHRMQSQSWNDLIKEMTAHRLPGKKSTLVIANTTLGATTTRNK